MSGRKLIDQDNARTSGLYSFVWRWHFYAGLLTAPFLIILALTGALYLFNHEIESWWYRDLIEVPRFANSVPASAQEAAILHAYPGSTVSGYVYPLNDHHASEWRVGFAGGRSRIVFVDPANASIRGSISEEWRLMQVVRNLHAKLLLGEPGQYVMELAACWGFILLITGLYMWWPRRARLMGGIVPRLSAGGRTFWKDLHSVPSAWNAGFIAFLVLTGLPWSIFWGHQLETIGTVTNVAAASPNFSSHIRLHSSAGMQMPMDMSLHVDHKGSPDLPWPLRDAPQPHAGPNATRIGIDTVLSTAQKFHILAPGLRVLYPRGPLDTFVLSFVPKAAEGQRNISIDPGNGAVLRNIGWRDYSPVAKVVEFGVMTHMGEEFGLLNQLVLLTSCSIFILTMLFGFIMWWRRRPPGLLGAPPITRGFSPNITVIAIGIALGIMLPLAGASMLAICALDFALMKWRGIS